MQSLIKDLTKSKGVGRIITGDDYENYLYEQGLNKSIRIGEVFGLRNLENFKNMRTLNREYFESLLTILNRFMGKEKEKSEEEKILDSNSGEYGG